MKKLLLVILIGFVSACASIERENLYNALTTWQGAPIEEYLAGHRSPDEVLQIANYTLYKWSRSSSGAIPMPVNTNCSTTGGIGGLPPQTSCNSSGGGSIPYTNSCTWAFRVQDEIIQSVEVTGNNCYVFSKDFMKPE